MYITLYWNLFLHHSLQMTFIGVKIKWHWNKNSPIIIDLDFDFDLWRQMEWNKVMMIEIFNVSIFVTGAIKGHRGSKSEHVSCTQTIKQLLLCTLCGPHCSPFLPTLMDYGMSKQTAFCKIDKLNLYGKWCSCFCSKRKYSL